MASIKLLAIVFVAIALVSGSESKRQQGYATIADLVTKTGNLKTVLAAASVAGLVPALSNPELNVTAFLPTDKAFSKAFKALNINATSLLTEPSGIELLKQILEYHIYASKVLDLAAMKSLARGSTVLTMMSGAKVTLVKAILPPSITLVDGLKRKASVSGYPYPGPMAAGKSVVWLIDNVILPGDLPSGPASSPTPSSSPAPTAPILVFLRSQNITALSDILAGLYDMPTLASFANVTVLAPTDAAFGVLEAFASKMGLSLDMTSIPPAIKALLQGIVGTHIIPGTYKAADLKDGMTLKTLSTAVLTVDLKSKPGSVLFKAPGGLPTDTATVVKANIMAPNNIVIHTIDTVLANINLASLG